MTGKKVKIFWFSIFFILSTFSFMHSQSFKPIRPHVVTPHLAGFGGSYVGLEAGFNSLFTNPAALATVDKEWNFLQISAQIAGPIFKIPDILKSFQDNDSSEDSENPLEDFDYIIDLIEENNGLFFDSHISGPISFGLVNRNFGFGIFNRTIASIDIPTISSVDIYGGEEFLLTGAFGWDVFSISNHSFAFGMQLKGFTQTLVGMSGSLLEILEIMNDNSFEIPIALAHGFGFDLGIMYRFSSLLNIGITCRDVFSPVAIHYYKGIENFLDASESKKKEIHILDPYLSVGFVFFIPLPVWQNIITSWKCMADYKDLFSFLNVYYRNPILNLALGTELILLDVIALRAGIHEGYLASGLGIDFSLFQLDFAMYGSELGFEPGRRPSLHMELGFSFKY